MLLRSALAVFVALVVAVAVVASRQSGSTSSPRRLPALATGQASAAASDAAFSPAPTTEYRLARPLPALSTSAHAYALKAVDAGLGSALLLIGAFLALPAVAVSAAVYQRHRDRQKRWWS